MPSTKISALTDGGRIRGTDILPAVRGAGNVRLSGPIMQFPGYVVNGYYLPMLGHNSAAGAGGFANLIRLAPAMVFDRITVSKLAIRIITTASGTNTQLAIYAGDSSTWVPTGTALATTSNMSNTSSGIVVGTLSQSVTLEPGRLYWFASNSDSAVVSYTGITNSGTGLGCFFARALDSAADILNASNTTTPGFTYATTFGTWPDLTGTSGSFGIVTNGSILPMIVYYVASIG